MAQKSSHKNLKCLIIGLNIGMVYKYELEKMGIQPYTLDIDSRKTPDFDNVSQIDKKLRFDLVIVCTPNYTHQYYIDKLIKQADIFLIEKPGLENSEVWQKYLNKTVIIMVKNNLYRPELYDLLNIIEHNEIEEVKITWETKNRIPFPGGWFTNKELSWGGFSRDILPHLLCFYYVLSNKSLDEPLIKKYIQKYNLDNIESTEYGTIQKENPIYDVDDTVELKFDSNNVDYSIKGSWKTDNKNQLNIEINFKDGRNIIYNYGLCPNNVYGIMIKDILFNHKISYVEHNEIDIFIHKIIERE